NARAQALVLSHFFEMGAQHCCALHVRINFDDRIIRQFFVSWRARNERNRPSLHESFNRSTSLFRFARLKAKRYVNLSSILFGQLNLERIVLPEFFEHTHGTTEQRTL